MMVVKDLVCGMDVDTETAEWKSVYEGQLYYFCSPGCKRDFDRDPDSYIRGQDNKHPPETGGEGLKV